MAGVGGGLQDLFAYGTLMCDDIMRAVSGRTYSGEIAILRGYRRLRVRGEHYPGLAEDTGASVDGVLYQRLPGPAWERLDRFEGPMYQRRCVSVELADGRSLLAQTYVVRPEYTWLLEDSEWDFRSFLRQGKARFVAGYAGYRAL
jgi:gamma-glutamylcyclotransferase (GGCT)/AIG2-like uncharacterized protein YtfP